VSASALPQVQRGRFLVTIVITKFLLDHQRDARSITPPRQKSVKQRGRYNGLDGHILQDSHRAANGHQRTKWCKEILTVELFADIVQPNHPQKGEVHDGHGQYDTLFGQIALPEVDRVEINNAIIHESLNRRYNLPKIFGAWGNDSIFLTDHQSEGNYLFANKG
jgi:hypothetical protein